VSTNQHPEQQGQPSPAPEIHGHAGDGQPLDPAFQQQIQKQLQEAIRPVLADFHLQVEQAAERMVQTDIQHDTNGKGGAENSQQVVARSDAETGAAPSPGQQSSGAQSSPQTPDSEQDSATADANPAGGGTGDMQLPARQESSAVTSSQGGASTGQPQSSWQQLQQAAVRLAERQAEAWLQAVLVSGLDAILAEPMRARAQQRAEDGLRAALNKAFEPLPKNATIRELREQTERTLSAILREVLDTVYAPQVRSDLEQRGKSISRDLSHGEFKGGLQQGEDALRMLVEALIPVIRRQWQRLLRLLLRMILIALQDTLGSDAGESLTSLTAEPGQASKSGESSA